MYYKTSRTSLLVSSSAELNMLLAAISLLCLVSLSRSAPPDCDRLVRPVDQLDLQHLEGRWVLVAGSISNASYLEIFKKRDSATIVVSRNTSDSNVSYTRSVRLDNKCLYRSYNITLQGSSFTFDGTNKKNLTAHFSHSSCPDCLLMRMDVESGRRQHFYLFSRRREVQQEEMEEFRAQVECLNMPPPVVKDPTKELCPDEETEGQKN